MSDMTDPDALEPFTRTCQIIVGALIMGVVIFLVIVILFLPARDRWLRLRRRCPGPAPADRDCP